MSVVAIDYDGLVSADSLVLRQGQYKTNINQVKIVRCQDGTIIGGVGSVGVSTRLKKYLESGLPIDKASEVLNEDDTALIVTRVSVLRVEPGKGIPFMVVPPYAIGCGWIPAVAAMKAGVDSAVAVQIVCEMDRFCEGPVISLQSEHRCYR